jgi:hypothetical protein
MPLPTTNIAAQNELKLPIAEILLLPIPLRGAK